MALIIGACFFLGLIDWWNAQELAKASDVGGPVAVGKQSIVKAATPLGGGNTLNGYIGAVAAIFWPSGHRRYWGDGECETGREQLEGGEKHGGSGGLGETIG